MSSIQTRFVPFSVWEPDSVEFEVAELEVAKNLLPVYGAYRPIDQARTVSSQTDSDPMTGGIAHLVSQEAPPIRQLPIAEGDLIAGEFWDEEFTPGTAANDYHDTKLATFEPDDSTYVRTNGDGTNTLAYRLSAPDVDPSPVSTGDVTLKFRIRLNRDSRYDPYAIDYELWERNGPTQIGTTQTLTLTDPDGQEWYEEEWDIPNTEFAKFTGNWDVLELVLTNFTPTVSGGGDDVQSCTGDEDIDNWKGYDSAGTEYVTDIYNYIDRGALASTAYRDEYVESPEIPPGETSVAIFESFLIPEPNDPTDGLAWFSFSATAAANKPNMTAEFQIIQPVTVGSDPVAGEVIVVYGNTEYRTIATGQISNLNNHGETSPPTAYDEDTFAITVPDTETLRLYNFDSKFYVVVKLSYGGGGAGSSLHTALPFNQYQTASSGVTVSIANIDNCVDGDQSLADGTPGITWVANTGTRRAYIGLGNNPQATSNSNHKVWFRAKSTGSSQNLIVKLMKNVSSSPEVVKNQSFTIGTAWEWNSITIGPSGARGIPDFSDIGLEFRMDGPANTMEVDECFYTYPGDSASARVYSTWFLNNSPDHFPRISWAALDSLNPKKSNARDRTEIYVGNDSSIYNVLDGNWVDVTRTVAGVNDAGTGGTAYGDMANLQSHPKIWDFCTFGDKVIATNFADEVQIKDVTDTDFSYIYDAASPYEPRARYCAVVSSSLVLGDINPAAHGTRAGSNYTDGKPFHLWVSKPMDPTYFDVADIANQTAIFALVGQPGAITGLVGGEHGTVFKRNSIWRMEYTGLPQIFQFDHIALGQGCAYPQSIVQVGQDIYFWGNGGIFALAGGTELVRISGQRIEKAIFDTRYESIAISQDFGIDSIQNESRVYGAYDAYSGLVWWVYKGLDDTDHKLNSFLVYSPKEDRFTHGNISDLSYSLILGRGNVTTSDTYLNRGLIALQYEDTKTNYVKFSDETLTYAAQIQTKIISPATWGYHIGRECEVQGVRVIYKADPSTYRPNFGITVEGSQDPTLNHNTVTRSVSMVSEDRDGWVPMGTSVSGEFFRFTLDIPALTTAQIKEVLGLQIKIRAAGDY